MIHFFAANIARTGVQTASAAATAVSSPKGSFFGELGGLISSVGGVALQTAVDIARMQAQTELSKFQIKAAGQVAPQLVPGQTPTAIDQELGRRFLPGVFRAPSGPAVVAAPPSAPESSGIPMVAILGGVAVLAVLLLKR